MIPLQSSNLPPLTLPSPPPSCAGAGSDSRAELLKNPGTPLLAARLLAMRAADRSALPQTVFRNMNTAGWSHTHASSRALQESDLFVTVLPIRYFE